MRANSISKIIATIIFLFIPFLGFLIRMTAEESSDIVSKIIKAFLLYIVCFLIVASCKKISIDKEYGKYFWATLFLAIPYLIHFFLSKSHIEHFNTYAMSELIVLAYMIILFTVASLMNFEFNDYRFLLWGFAICGIVLGFQSMWYSVSVVPTSFLDRYVGEFLRAGTEATDPNLVSAVLNICSMAGIGLYLIGKNIIGKIFSIFAFLISQAGRFLTFSTGGFLSILISLTILFLLLKGNVRRAMFRFIIIILIISSVLIISSGMADILFYRITFLDEATAQSSVYSRLEQHSEFLRLMGERPLMLLFGVGSARLPELLGLNITLHNSYLRPLAIGGIISFGAFVFLYWLCLRNFQKSLRYTLNPKMKFIIAPLFAAFIGWSFQAATLPADSSGVNIFFFVIAYSLKRTIWIDYEKHINTE